MKSYGVAIQMKPLQQYFHVMPFILYVVLTLNLWMQSCGMTIQMKRLLQMSLERDLQSYHTFKSL